MLSQLSGSYAAELKAQRARLDELVGDAHWLSVGSYKEALLRRVLRNRLPKKFEVSTGFVLARHQGQRLISAQIDVLVWNAADHAPLFRDDEFVIVPPESVHAAIEVKGRLVQPEIAEALQNLERVTTLARFVHEFGPARPPFRAIFAFSRKTREEGDAGYVSWPATVFNSLWAHYKTGDAQHPWSLDDRLQEARSVVPGRWSLPWIDMVSVLGDGFVELEEWGINGEKVPTYAAYNSSAAEDLSYNALEKSLLLRLLAPEGLYLHERPGFASVLVREKGTRSSPPFMPLEKPPANVASIGQLSSQEVAVLAGSHHRPHGAGWP